MLIGCNVTAGMAVVSGATCAHRYVCIPPLSSWLPLHSQLCASSGLFQETEHCGDSFHVVEELWEVSGAAIGGEVPVACSGIVWAFEQYVLHCLGRFAAVAGDLLRYMLGVEALCIGPYKSMACDQSVERTGHCACELSWFLPCTEGGVCFAIWRSGEGSSICERGSW